MEKLSIASYDDHIKFMKKYYPDITVDNYSACWNGAKYLRNLSGIDSDIDGSKAYPKEVNEEIFNNKKKLTDFLEELFQDTGIYHFFQENVSEIHYFTIIVKNKDYLTLIETYGGLDKLTVKNFKINDWIDNYVKSTINNDLDAYQYVFQIPNFHFKKLNIKNVKLEALSYNKV